MECDHEVHAKLLHCIGIIFIHLRNTFLVTLHKAEESKYVSGKGFLALTGGPC